MRDFAVIPYKLDHYIRFAAGMFVGYLAFYGFR
jgi:hypothetical protein